MVLVLANENLNAIINTLGSHCAHIQQHLHRRPGAPAVTSVSYLTIYVYMWGKILFNWYFSRHHWKMSSPLRWRCHRHHSRLEKSQHKLMKVLSLAQLLQHRKRPRWARARARCRRPRPRCPRRPLPPPRTPSPPTQPRSHPSPRPVVLCEF